MLQVGGSWHTSCAGAPTRARLRRIYNVNIWPSRRS